jgi:hypothetical protein
MHSVYNSKILVAPAFIKNRHAYFKVHVIINVNTIPIVVTSFTDFISVIVNV